MWNTVTSVANFNNLPEAELVDFAISRDSTYDIVIDLGNAIVSNFFVDRLVTDFKREAAEAAVLSTDEDQAVLSHALAQRFDVGCGGMHV